MFCKTQIVLRPTVRWIAILIPCLSLTLALPGKSLAASCDEKAALYVESSVWHAYRDTLSLTTSTNELDLAGLSHRYQEPIHKELNKIYFADSACLANPSYAYVVTDESNKSKLGQTAPRSMTWAGDRI